MLGWIGSSIAGTYNWLMGANSDQGQTQDSNQPSKKRALEDSDVNSADANKKARTESISITSKQNLCGFAMLASVVNYQISKAGNNLPNHHKVYLRRLGEHLGLNRPLTVNEFTKLYTHYTSHEFQIMTAPVMKSILSSVYAAQSLRQLNVNIIDLYLTPLQDAFKNLDKNQIFTGIVENFFKPAKAFYDKLSDENKKLFLNPTEDNLKKLCGVNSVSLLPDWAKLMDAGHSHEAKVSLANTLAILDIMDDGDLLTVAHDIAKICFTDSSSFLFQYFGIDPNHTPWLALINLLETPKEKREFIQLCIHGDRKEAEIAIQKAILKFDDKNIFVVNILRPVLDAFKTLNTLGVNTSQIDSFDSLQKELENNQVLGAQGVQDAITSIRQLHGVDQTKLFNTFKTVAQKPELTKKDVEDVSQLFFNAISNPKADNYYMARSFEIHMLARYFNLNVTIRAAGMAPILDDAASRNFLPVTATNDGIHWERLLLEGEAMPPRQGLFSKLFSCWSSVYDPEYIKQMRKDAQAVIGFKPPLAPQPVMFSCTNVQNSNTNNVAATSVEPQKPSQKPN